MAQLWARHRCCGAATNPTLRHDARGRAPAAKNWPQQWPKTSVAKPPGSQTLFLLFLCLKSTTKDGPSAWVRVRTRARGGGKGGRFWAQPEIGVAVQQEAGPPTRRRARPSSPSLATTTPKDEGAKTTGVPKVTVFSGCARCPASVYMPHAGAGPPSRQVFTPFRCSVGRWHGTLHTKKWTAQALPRELASCHEWPRRCVNEGGGFP